MQFEVHITIWREKNMYISLVGLIYIHTYAVEVMSTGYSLAFLSLIIQMVVSINSSRGNCSSLVRASLACSREVR